MKKLLYSTLLVVFGLFQAQAQSVTKRICGTQEHMEMLLKADPMMKSRIQALQLQADEWIANHPQNKTATVITIPVVVHVVWNTASQNISDNQILSQIDVLNEDFARLNADAANTPGAFSGLAANTQIQFCIAKRDPSGNATTGIVRKQTATSSFSTNDNIKRNANGGDDAWPSAQYLNIWTGNLSGGVLGYAQFPGGPAATDGVVILYNAFGRVGNVVAPFHLGRTATHEVGHWLNLKHIWGDDGSACSGSDGVTDTPNQSSENYGCPSFPHTDACTSSSPGVMFMNYMDYTDDNCMNMFSSGQSTRMNSSLNSSRASIITSLGCVPPTGGSCAAPSGLTATGITISAATLNWSSVSGALSYNVRYRVTGAASWISTTATSNSKNLTGLTSNSNYEFQVQTVCSGSTSSFTASANFTTTSQGCSDVYEPNNTLGTAKPIATNVDVTGLISSSSDADWFTFNTTSPNTKVKVTLTNLPADYDMKLTNASSSTVFGTSQNGGTTNETIIVNTTTARTYKLKIYGYNGVFNANTCYTVRVSLSSSNFRTQSEFEVVNDEYEQILVVYPNPVKDLMTVQFNSSETGNAEIRIFDMLGRNVLMTNERCEKGINKFEMNLSHFNKGIYFLEVTNGSEKEIKKLVVDK